jgi:hypothetical protein
MPSRQERRNARLVSCSSLILNSTSSIIGPHAFVSTCWGLRGCGLWVMYSFGGGREEGLEGECFERCEFERVSCCVRRGCVRRAFFGAGIFLVCWDMLFFFSRIPNAGLLSLSLLLARGCVARVLPL